MRGSIGPSWHIICIFAFCTVLTAYSPDDLPTSLDDCPKLAEESLCKRLSRLLILLATVPVTTNFCERNISNLWRLKAYLRSTMTRVHLSGLALLHTHYTMPVNRDEVLKLFFQRSAHRIVSTYTNEWASLQYLISDRAMCVCIGLLDTVTSADGLNDCTVNAVLMIPEVLCCMFHNLFWNSTAPWLFFIFSDCLTYI